MYYRNYLVLTNLESNETIDIDITDLQSVKSLYNKIESLPFVEGEFNEDGTNIGIHLCGFAAPNANI